MAEIALSVLALRTMTDQQSRIVAGRMQEWELRQIVDLCRSELEKKRAAWD